MRSTAFKVTALLCAVVLAAVGLMLGSGYETARQSDSLRLTAAFYPVYVLALNVTEGVEGVTVDNLVASTTGCLHDYQLSPADLVSLRSSDALLLSGAGAERFLDPVRERYPDLPLIDSSVGIELLCASHAHEHTDDHDHHEGDAPNSHIWTSPARYARQAQNLCDGLCALDPQNAAHYRRNTAAYVQKIEAVAARLQAAADGLPAGSGAVLFHDSLAYLANDLGLTVLATLSVGEEDGVSAADLAAASDAIRTAPHVLFLYDTQYRDLQYRYLQEEAAAASVLFLDTAVSGEDSADAWLSAMESIAAAFEEVSA